VPAAYATEVVALYQGIANGRVVHQADERVLRGTTTLEDWVTQAVAA
jgi:hypothetical protein